MTSAEYASAKRAGPVSYTHRAVAHYRRRPFIRLLAFALMLWLGLDHAAAGVCCQREVLGGTAGSAWASDRSDSGAPSNSERGDTCFCCALVVGPAPVHVRTPHLEAVSVTDIHPPDRPGIRPVPYHPPQFHV
jgi:hypothetical protein